ncbi:CDK5 regulatory subunit-associated protein 3-like [Oppia nitens]|uniref:CDK5 regulatory subunit-associated protein 3-like n=1 Tax=Oppia nitens TaxID=1686743 RepID=UPI0023DB1318|nr:CDK5 regulatory subunit-associated protein 3-like [Oppia nitens]
MSESNLPIDIHTNKLLDWLISRRHCPKEWQQSLTEIRNKIKSAIEDMPPNDNITQLLSNNYIEYSVCQKITEVLKVTEKESKNVFGYYSSQRMKDWLEITKLYEKDSIYLADWAQSLIRNVNYEVPSLKKQLAKCQQTIEECEKGVEDCLKQSNAYKNEYTLSANNLGITGQNIKEELTAQLNDLPTKLDKIYKEIPELSLVKDYYQTFLSFTLKKDKMDCLKVLCYLLERGNTTYFEYRTGIVPEVIEEFKSTLCFSDDNGVNSDAGNDNIDFGDGIDFGDDTASTETPSTGNGDFVHIERDDLSSEQIDFGSDGDGINWDITSGPNDEIKSSDDNIGNVAKGEDAQSVLMNTNSRNDFINELIEIEGFLDQRLFELRSDEDIVSSNQFQNAPPLLQLTTPDGVSAMLEAVKRLLAKLMTPKMKVLYYMKDSTKYIENVSQKLKHIETLSERAANRSKLFESKRLTAIENMRQIEPKIPLLINQTRDLQRKIESDISKRYKNRFVNIMGGIQVL